MTEITNWSEEANRVLTLCRNDVKETEIEHCCKELKALGDQGKESFSEFVLYHQLAPLVSKQLDKKGMGEDFLPIIIEKNRTAFQAMAYLRELVDIATLFEQHGIHMLAVKGPLLALHLYGNLAMRTCGDIDILIAGKDLEKAAILLEEKGYGYGEGIDTPGKIKKYKKRQSLHYGFVNKTTGISVELHWRMEVYFEIPFEQLWENRETVRLLNQEVFTLSRSDRFFCLCMHGIRHGFYRLKWLVDVLNDAAMLSEKEQHNVNQRFLAYGMQDIGAVLCRLLALANPSKQHQFASKLSFSDRNCENTGRRVVDIIVNKINTCDERFISKKRDYTNLLWHLMHFSFKKQMRFNIEGMYQGILRRM